MRYMLLQSKPFGMTHYIRIFLVVAVLIVIPNSLFAWGDRPNKVLYPMDDGGFGGGGGGGTAPENVELKFINRSSILLNSVEYVMDPGAIGTIGKDLEENSGRPVKDDDVPHKKNNPRSDKNITDKHNITKDAQSPAATSETADMVIKTVAVSNPTLLEQIRTNKEIENDYHQYLRSVLKRETEILQERKRLVEHGLWIGHSMWLTAHLLVIFCAYLSYIEFSNARKLRKQDVPQELKVSLEGIALKTTLHGAFLLVIAMCFYFMYIKYVYLPGF